MYATIRQYEAKEIPDLAKRIETGLIPLLRKAPGFVAYYLVNAGDGKIASFGAFQSKAGADESNRLAADWVEKNIKQYITSPVQITAGEVTVNT
jgi:hypothetical protein